MKRIFLMFSILIILITLVGCGEKPALRAQNLSNEYLEKLYTFRDTDKVIDEQSKEKMMNEFAESIKPYMTEEAYNNHIASRDLVLTYNAACSNRCNISVTNIKTSLKRESKEDKYYVMDYSIDVIATPLNGDKEKKFPITGEMTVKQDGKKFLVDYFNYFDSKEWSKYALNL